MTPLLLEADAEVEEIVDEIATEYSSVALRVDDPSNSRSSAANAPAFHALFPSEVSSRLRPSTRIADASAVVTSPGGQVQAELALYLEDRKVTASGGQLVATDESQCLTILIDADFMLRAGNLTVNWTGGAGVLPETVMPALNFLRHFRPENLLTFLYQGEELSPPQRIGNFWEPLPERLIEAIAKLEHVQRATSTRFPIPDAFSAVDMANLVRAEGLLNGQIIRGTWSRMVVSLTLHKGASMPEGAATAAFLLDTQESIEIAGNSILLGRARRHLLSARVESWVPSQRDPQRGRLELVPDEVDEFESWLPTVLVNYTPVPGVSAHFRELFSDFMSRNSEAMRRLAQ